MKTIQDAICGQEDLSRLSPEEQALSVFYGAFNNRDLKKMAQSWAQSPDVIEVNPLGGIRYGWPEIEKMYEAIFTGPAEVYVEFFDYSIHELGDMFYAVGRERGEARMGDTVIPLAIRTSRVFQRIEGQWRQVHHSGSIEDPQTLAAYQSAMRSTEGMIITP